MYIHPSIIRVHKYVCAPPNAGRNLVEITAIQVIALTPYLVLHEVQTLRRNNGFDKDFILT